MEHLFVSFFQTHFEVFKQFGYIIILLVTYVESVPLLGMLVPGQTMIILAGFMVKLHIFGFWLSVLIATIGATFGDITGYYLGHKYGHKIKKAEKMFYLKKEQIESTISLISSHPFKTIFFGRLHSLTRTLTPFAAGVSNIGFKKFVFINILSSFSWAFISILIGFIFGKSFEKASAFIGSFILVATFVVLCIILAAHYAKKKNIRIHKTDVFVFIVSTISLYLFVLIGQDLSTAKLLSVFDQRIQMLRHIIVTPLLTQTMIFITTLGGPILFPVISVLFMLYLFIKKQFGNLLLLGGTLLSGFAVLETLKDHYARVRPIGMILESRPSFPSGHISMTIILAVLVSYIIIRHVKPIWKKNIYLTISYTLPILVGVSRVYLGVHWASDIIGGLMFGIFWATFGIVVFKGVRFMVNSAKKTHEIPLP